MDINSVMIRNIVRVVNNFYNEMTLHELHTHFSNLDPTHIIFNAPLGNVGDYYYPIDQSIKILTRLIMYQCSNRVDRYNEFMLSLKNILNREIPKVNTLYIVSAPNAGKNFFFDAVIHYCINFGQMGNFSRYDNFPLMDCVDRRVILWNEPCFEPSACETLKMILGGDTVPAKIKYQPDAIITRTPVIVLSNNDVFPNDKAFNSRIKRYDWKTCPWLKKCNKKPHPLCIYHLLKKYM